MKTQAAGGFTLLELLVALAVFGFLLVGLSQTVRFGLAAWQRNAHLSENKADLEAVDRSVRSLVENLDPGDDSGRPSIDGKADSLTGVTQLRLPGGGMTPVRVEAGLAVSGSRLVLRWRPYHHWVPFGPLPAPTETALLPGVSRIGIEYWRAPGIWVSQWHEPDLPLLIRVRLTLTGFAAARWPDIVVAPLLSRP